MSVIKTPFGFLEVGKAIHPEFILSTCINETSLNCVFTLNYFAVTLEEI